MTILQKMNHLNLIIQMTSCLNIEVQWLEFIFYLPHQQEVRQHYAGSCGTEEAASLPA